MLQSGKPIEASEILNSELTGACRSSRVTLRAQLAEQSSTLLDNHPRIKELKAQLADIDRQIREKRASCRARSERFRALRHRSTASAPALKPRRSRRPRPTARTCSCARWSAKPVAARPLNPISPKYREATRAKYRRGAGGRRIISRALVSNHAAFPKKAADRVDRDAGDLMLSAGCIRTAECCA